VPEHHHVINSCYIIAHQAKMEEHWQNKVNQPTELDEVKGNSLINQFDNLANEE